MKILVGLSGGVDSAVAAYLLKEQGYEVTCAFMRNWDSAVNDDVLGNPTLQDDICTQEQDYLDAQHTASALGLPLERVDFIEEYWQEVFQTFLQEYRKGRTPNPDILCNRYIKFDHFYRFAESLGFDTLATGHYAGIGTWEGKAALLRADDRNKDQSYFLCQIQRPMLDHVVFPLQHWSKPQVRQKAEALHLPVAEKKDSTGICFIGERRFRQFLSNYLPMQDGPIRLITDGRTVGRHHGVFYYTVGQRKGLEIGGTGPYFVIGKNVGVNELYVTDESHQDWLYSDACDLEGFNVLLDVQMPLDCTARFRYRQPDVPVHVEQQEDGSLLLSYPQTSRGVTPGQEAVLYLGELVIGGGVIRHVYREGKDLMEQIQNRMQHHEG